MNPRRLLHVVVAVAVAGGLIQGLGLLAPGSEHVHLSAHSAPAYVCSSDGGAVAVVRTAQLPEFSEYSVTCSDGVSIPASW